MIHDCLAVITNEAPRLLVYDLYFPLIAESSRVALELDSFSYVGPSESAKVTIAFRRM